jgi:hypothetical protein
MFMAKIPGGDDRLKQSVAAALEHHNKRRRRGKSTSTKKPKGGFDKKTAKAIEKGINSDDRKVVDLVVPAAAQAHGDYRLVDFKLTETIDRRVGETEGKLVTKVTRVIRNVGGSPVERWYARGKLDERQMSAILFYQAAWRAFIGEPRVTANYSPAIARNIKGSIELYASSVMRAKEGLRLLDQEVFFREPVEYFEVWQNVVIWDERAGVAGSRLGYCNKPAEAIASEIVRNLAGKIADIVIDQSRRDFGDLLLDIDAPRKPRGGRK